MQNIRLRIDYKTIGWVIALMSCGVFGQAQTPTAAPAFDAASIKPTPPERPEFPYRFGPDGIFVRSTLGGLVMSAYQATGYQVAGGPAWARSAFYDVQARAEGDADLHQIRLMLQTLLADRFQLKLHRETRMMAGYVLSMDKGGPKLPPSKTDWLPEARTVQPLAGGGIISRGMPIKYLALVLGMQLGQPVIDETKIEGIYDFRLRYDDVNPTSGSSPSEFGSVFSAIHDIGLNLTAKKIPLEVLVIDSAERPSEN